MANYINELLEMKAYARRAMLPKGSTPKYGNIIFLYSDSFNNTTAMINNQIVKNDKKYYYYFYESEYFFKIYNKPFRVRDLENRGKHYLLINKLTSLQPHPKKGINDSDYHNTYFDMYKYVELFKQGIYGASIDKKVTEFIKYFSNILKCADDGYEYKAMMIDATKHPIPNGKLLNKLDSPLFMIYYILYAYFDSISSLNMDIIIYSNNMIMHFNPSTCDEKSHVEYKRELSRIMSKVEGVSDEDKKDALRDKVKSEIIDSFGFTGEESLELDIKIDAAINSATDKSNSMNIEPDVTTIKHLVKTDINDDNDVVNIIYDKISSDIIPVKPVSSKRDQLLRERQKKILINNTSLDDLSNKKGTQIKLEKTDISKSVKTLNKNMHSIAFPNFDKLYNDELMTKDILGVFTSLSTKDIPMTIISVDIKETSDTLNYKDTYNVKLVDVNGTQHSVTVDMPKLYENKFLYLGGNKKIIDKQNFLFPVVKTGPDTVQVVTNYNKAFIRRIDTRSISSIEKFKKLMLSKDISKYCIYGTCFEDNQKYISSLEYDELSKIMTEFNHKNMKIIFSQKVIAEENKDINIPDGHICIGFYNKNPMLLNVDTQTVEIDGNEMRIVELMVSRMGEYNDVYNEIKSGKRLMYSSITIMAQLTPLIIVLSFWEGLEKVLTKANIEYVTVKSIKGIDRANKAIIKFADGYLVYTKTTQSELLLNGLNVFEFNKLNFMDMCEKEIYIKYFTKIYGKSIITSALQNFYIFMIDNITEEILEEVNLPTDIVSLMLYANELLADNQFTQEIHQSMSRIRSNEVIAAILYSKIANSYIQVRNSGGKSKLSIPRDCVIKELLKLQTVEDYSTLNPIVEVGKATNVSSKGFRGANIPEAYNELKRSFDVSMLGTIGMSSSPDANVGVMRSLTMEPNIISARGFVNSSNDIKDLKDVNLFSLPELLTSNSATKDDSIRTAMAVKQSKHVIPTKKSSPVLISNGSEEVIRFHLSSDFAINADNDGEIVEYDRDKEMMIAKYKNGEYRAIDLSNHIVKNGAGGFFLENQLVTDLKVGDKFKKNDMLAYHKKFFTPSKLNNTRMNMGPLLKVACASSYNTYQDSGFITDKASIDLGTDMVFEESIVMGKNANVDKFLNIGDEVDVGDILVQYDTSYDETEVNKFLSSLGKEEQDLIRENSKTSIKSHYGGTVIDIKIYATVELDELSPTLRKMVSSYYNKIKHRKNLLDKYSDKDSLNKAGILFTDSIDVVKPNMYGVIKGEKVGEGVLVKYYIKYNDIMSVGDKGANFTALKFVTGEKIPKGFEPYSAFRPNEEVSLTFSSNGVLKRMTTSVLVTMFANKCIVEHKRKLKEIYDR